MDLRVKLTRCEAALGGYLIKWYSPSAELGWHAFLRRVQDLPHDWRYYVQEERAWWISARGMATLRGYILNYDDAESIRPRQRAALPPEVAEAYRTLHLRESAPLGVARAVYRALAKEVHPDTVGDHEAMRRLNGAYACLCDWLAPIAAAA